MVALCLCVCAGAEQHRAEQHRIDARQMLSTVNFLDLDGMKEVVVSILATQQQQQLELQQQQLELNETKKDNVAFRADIAAQRTDMEARIDVMKEELENKTGREVSELRHENAALRMALQTLSKQTLADILCITVRLDHCEGETTPFIQLIKHRRMQEEESLCQGEGMGQAAMLGACCPSHGGTGNGHRFLQMVQGCDELPATCSAGCAVLFIAYFNGCQATTNALPVDSRQSATQRSGARATGVLPLCPTSPCGSSLRLTAPPSGSLLLPLKNYFQIQKLPPQKRPKPTKRPNTKNGRNAQKPGNMRPIPHRWGIHGNRNISFCHPRNALA